jgi:F0F1-type ATP synthase assembly protein I
MDGGRGAGNRAGKVQDAGRGRAASGVSGAEFAGLGFQFALTILVFVFVGVWLDRHLGTSPWLLLVCVFAGAAGGFYSMYRRVSAAQRRDAERLADQRKQSGDGGSG